MSIWKRVVIYLTRKKGRTILLFLYMTVMAIFILTVFSLKNAAEKELFRLLETFGTGFVLKINTENPANVTVVEENGMIDSRYIGTKITDEMIQKILELDGVTNYTLPKEYNIVWTDLKLRPGAWAEMMPDEDTIFTEEYLKLLRQEILEYSCTDGKLSKNFRMGALEISKGRNLKRDDRFRTVISEELAERNGLSVGDTITIEVKEGTYLPTKEYHKTWGEPIQLEIAGLFHMNLTQQYSELTNEYGYMENNIYVDQETHEIIDKIIADNWEGDFYDVGYPEVIFFVDDPKKTDYIIQEMKDREDIPTDSLTVYPDQTAYEASAKPYSLIRTFSTILLAIGIAGAGIILYLLMKLTVRGRMRETGILLSIGIKKRKIVGQMLIECLAVSAAALVLAILLSAPLVSVCSQVAERLATPDAKEETYRVTLRDAMYPEVEKASSDEVVLSSEVTPGTVMLLIVLVSGISAASVLLASIQILGTEPKRLLQSM